GIVPVPYSRGGIEVRASVSGGPAEAAGIHAGDCVLGIGKRLVNSTSDASAELRKHTIGDRVSYLYHRGRCGGETKGEVRTTRVRRSSRSRGRTSGRESLHRAGRRSCRTFSRRAPVSSTSCTRFPRSSSSTTS